MQFFPASAQAATAGQNTAASMNAAEQGLFQSLYQGANKLGRKAFDGLNGSANFADLFGKLNLKEFDPENMPGLPAGFKSVKDDKSFVKSKDLTFLEKNLSERGVNSELLQNFMAALNAQPETPGVGKILGLARDLGRKGETLDEQERIAFTGLMRRIGFSAEESGELEQMTLDGKGAKALDRIGQKLNAAWTDADKNPAAGAFLPEGMLRVSREEAAALLKALNLSDGAAKHVLDFFGEENELGMNRQGFGKLFSAANAELTKEAADLTKLREAAPAVVREMLRNSRQEARNEAVSDKRGSRMLDRTEALIRDTATLLEEDEENKNAAPARKTSIMASILDKSGRIDKSVLERNAGAGFEREETEKELGRESARKFSDSLKGNADKKIVTDDRTAAAPGKESAATRLEARAEAIFSAATPAPASAAASGNAPADARAVLHRDKIFEQLQQGIVRNNSNGSHQITMRLDPPDLGRISLSLTVAGNEIKALIRAEQSEVAQAVSEQLAQLKASLEEQGFKVSGLDVETQTKNQPDLEGFSSAEQREKREELEARADFLRLARDRAKEEAMLARNVQSNDHTAINSDAGLHLIA